MSLRVTGVRDDGYHLLDAEMVTLDLHDTLEIEPVDAEVRGRIEVVGPDGPVDVGSDDDNLVRRALDLVGRSAHVRVHKRIRPAPGSAADRPTRRQCCGGPVTATSRPRRRSGPTCPSAWWVAGPGCGGIGEIVEPLAFDDRTYTLLTPPFGCSTPAVYAAWDRLGGPTGETGNDLEPAALAVAPELATWRDALAEATGERPRLAGSGSTWFVPGAHPGPGRTVATTVPAGA